MAKTTAPTEKHRFSQFLPHWLHKRVQAHVRAEKKKGLSTSVTQVIEELVYQAFSGKQKKRAA